MRQRPGGGPLGLSVRAALSLILLPTAILAQDAAQADWTMLLRTAGVYESNIDHDAVAVPAYGGILGAGLAYRNRAVRPTFEAAYEVALHRFAEATPWDRVSHQGELGLEIRPADWWSLRTEGEITLRGSSEDRDLGDQYEVGQRLELRPARGTAVRLTGLLRLKRYPEAHERNAHNRAVDLELRQRLVSGSRLTLRGRLEANVARAPRYGYQRQTYEIELATRPWSRDELGLGLTFRSQRYRERLVEGPRGDRPRQDYRVEPAVEWIHRFHEGLTMVVQYELEQRSSNDADKEYSAQQVRVEFIRTW